MESKSIVLAGSISDIGHSLAWEFLVQGHPVVLNGRDVRKMDKAMADFRDLGYKKDCVAGNMREEGVFEALMTKGKEAFGKMDIWINSVGLPQCLIN